MPLKRVAALTVACCAGSAWADIQFRCPAQVASLQQEVPGYLRALNISAAQFVQTVDAPSGVLVFALATPAHETRTLDLFRRAEYSLGREQVRLPVARGKARRVATVSRKEIMLALLQHGRVTEFTDEACSVEALADHVGVRQNLVAWAENLNWVWPDGGAARWNSKYWTAGTPNAGVPLHAALMDVFSHQEKYTLGCYTATKIVVAHGVLDYYRRVKGDPVRTRRVEAALLADAEPLVGVEPGKMWEFEADAEPHEVARPGKLLSLLAGVAADNIVPGDWIYLLNTDAATYKKTGYEGSNAIYLGWNRFDDYFNENRHAYTYEQKLNEVYQWRNGVFNRIRDAKKIKPLTARELIRLGGTPASGGIQLDIRAVPKHF